MEEYIVIVYEGRTEWRQNGKVHRINGPAVEYLSGDKLWYQNGQLHRTDGPAIECLDGHKKWWIKGKEYTEEEFLKLTSPVKELTVAQISELLGYEVKVVR
jgi:hypothetical protein